MTNSQWLGAAVSYAAGRGYRVISQSDYRVQMLKPKQKSCLLVAILLLLGILPGLVYLALSVDKSLLLTDTGDFIQSNQGKRKAQVVSYQALSEGKYGKLIKRDLSAFWWGLITLFVLLIALLTLIMNTPTPAVKLDSVAQTAQAVAKATERAKPTPTPIYYDSSRVYPEVVPNLYIEIIGNKKTMTDIQFKDYLTSIVGKRLHMKANVYEVQDEYMQMSPVDGGLFDAAFLYDVPREMLLNINKGAIIEFDATVKELDQFIISQLRLGDPVIYTISK